MDEPEPTIELSPEAQHDLERHVTWLAERNPQAAHKLNDRLFHMLDLLSAGGLDGPAAVLPSGERVRRFFVDPFHVYHARRPGRVLHVVRLYHHAREPIT